MQTAPLTASLTSDGVAALRLSVEWVQAARHGSIELDVLIAEVLRCASTSDLGDAARASDRTVGGARWSTDLDAALTLLPHDYNFSTGCRDGVYWAWIQPNDAWAPAEHEARHDHPGGSGLVTAHTAALAMICAAILLRIHRVMGADDVAELLCRRLGVWSRGVGDATLTREGRGSAMAGSFHGSARTTPRV